ncbi:hypothetical protein KDD93_06875 [Campylobacter sp. faydin G-24]|uniref:Phage protein n=1 Tax=Campylobacter anatolicus TaxID=2829105 RepID=A0ABS5HJ49_9BACT|nr:hypothetical protein [Campylobacter anatolicus]MBR8461480.1 hypothetical protein [Campylobacter anatolicus]MBR8464283.1 hypothetical protein [Campylobacter anatolicus]
MINVNELIKDPDFSQILSTDNGVKFNAVIQYLSNDEMAVLPEGQRFIPHIRIDTDYPLKIGEVVIYKGVKYRVKFMQEWDEYGYTNYTGVRYDGLESDDSEGFKIT